ncbi:hypothetical protein TNCV_4080171 [Trichonephila clavipes]|nr:hypothetical protein TNCV_4080171 [Trichonephila clavipes]
MGEMDHYEKREENRDIFGERNAKRSHIKRYLGLEVERPGLRRSFLISGQKESTKEKIELTWKPHYLARIFYDFKAGLNQQGMRSKSVISILGRISMYW